MAMATVNNWRVKNGTTHSARVFHVLESGLYNDVKLIVGPEKKEILAHKLPLKIASPYFENMFKVDVDKNEFEIPDIDELVFRQFMQFVYTGEWAKNPKSALLMLNAANILQVPDLATSCRKILKDNLTEENALTIFRQAALYNENELKELVKAVIFKFAYNIVESKDFLILSEENLEELIKEDELAVKDEVQLFEALVRWAEAECVRQNHPITSKCCGSLLQKLIPLVRFPQMDNSEFASSVAFREILTPEQEQACMMASFYGVSKNPRLESRGPFNAAPRNYYLPKFPCIVDRLYFPDSSGPMLIGSVSEIIWHRISFMANEKIWIKSVMLNPHGKAVTPSTPSFSIEVRLEDEALENIYAVKTQIVRPNNLKHFPIEFDKPVKIEKTVWYTVSLRVAGDYAGFVFTGGEEVAFCDGKDGKDVKISFRDSTSPDKSPLTTVQKGQMAQLEFLLY